MKKILWIGEYAIPSGFGNVNRAIIQRIKKHFEITVVDTSAIVKEPEIEKDETLGIFYTGLIHKDDKLAIERLKNIEINTYDIVFILEDIWNIHLLLFGLINSKKYLGKIVAYFPIDNPGADTDYYEYFNRLDAAVVYTKFANEEFLNKNPDLEHKTSIIPHGIEYDLFYKIENKNKLREDFFKSDQLNDKFIFLNANRNLSRKRLDLTIEAFSNMQNKNTMLWMHCGVTDRSMNIKKLGKRFGVSNRLILTDIDGNIHGARNVSVEILNKIYNATDAGVNSSMGEGWGLTNAEHASLGKPQIVGRHTAFIELYSGIDKDLLVDIKSKFTYDISMNIGYLIDPLDMAQKMDKVANLPAHLYEDLSKNTETQFSESKYCWNKIVDKWHSLFSELVK